MVTFFECRADRYIWKS